MKVIEGESKVRILGGQGDLCIIGYINADWDLKSWSLEETIPPKKFVTGLFLDFLNVVKKSSSFRASFVMLMSKINLSRNFFFFVGWALGNLETSSLRVGSWE